MVADPNARLRITAALGWIEPTPGDAPRLVRRPRVEIARERGTILALSHAGACEDADVCEPPDHSEVPTVDLGNSLLFPGLVNAHSHAFQRMIRGATHRRGAGDPSSFWSWRQAMYTAANALDPEGVYAQTRACFAEMLARGITCVGEFHYLHHQPDGRPYADANELSLQVIRAAASVGLRLCLLEVYYARAGADQPGPLPEQRRFCDANVDAYLGRLDALRTLAEAHREHLRVGVAPHSVRAVPAQALTELAAYARAHDLVVHSHVSEQPLENTQCREEHGRTPLEVFADAGCLDRPGRFTAVHAIHVSAADLERMRGQQICACPSTEADLGDGVIPAARWLAGGARLALGSDSNALVDLVREANMLEMHERLVHLGRLRLTDETGAVAPVLAAAATTGGAAALGRPELGRLALGSPFDALAFDLDHPTLRGVEPRYALDALLTLGSAEPLTQVWVGGQRRR